MVKQNDPIPLFEVGQKVWSIAFGCWVIIKDLTLKKTNFHGKYWMYSVRSIERHLNTWQRELTLSFDEIPQELLDQYRLPPEEKFYWVLERPVNGQKFISEKKYSEREIRNNHNEDVYVIGKVVSVDL